MEKSAWKVPTWIGLLLIFAASFTACEDKIDSTAERPNTGETITDYLNSHSDYSDFAYLLTRVGTDVKSVASVSALLNTKGHFTCFVPDNAAVEAYLDSIFETKGYKVEDTPDSIAELIVNNAIIDNGDDDAYLSTLFTTGALAQRSLAGQYIMISFRSDVGGTFIYADTYSRITRSDLPLDNGLIHRVDRVVMPYTSSLPSLIAGTDNLKIFSKLLQMTGWDKQMLKYRDYEFEKQSKYYNSHRGCETCDYYYFRPKYHNEGYTAFVEPDSLLCARWGLSLNISERGNVLNWNEVLTTIKEKCKALYPDATSEDLQSEDNAVNQFVSYHLIGESIPNSCMVIHYNEQGCRFRNLSQLGINAWTYYTTMGKQRRILKVTEGKTTEGKRINRYVAQYNLKDYSEMSVPRPGIKVSETNGGRVYGAENGFYYVVDDILAYDKDVADKVLNERMRYDVSDFFPEQMSSGFRRCTNSLGLGIASGYFSTAWYDDSNTDLIYLPGWYMSWADYQGDEYVASGSYDITLQLPPVPSNGTYELRLGCQNLAQRGMVQVYFGTDRKNLQPCGLPIDFRIYGIDPSIGWVADGDDEEVNAENDKAMLAHGYMKAPLYFGTNSNDSLGTHNNFRGMNRVLRKILLRKDMDPNVTYYIRFKSLLENPDLSLFLDYFEIVPKSVYDGPVAEDKW